MKLYHEINILKTSGIVYKYNYGGCNAPYYGKTERHFKVRMREHLGVSALTGKRMKGDNNSAINDSVIYFAIIHLVLTIFPY